MTESKVVNSWIKEAVDKTRLEDVRIYFVQLLDKRFPNELTPEVTKTINSQPSQMVPEGWFKHACRVEVLADFVKLLRVSEDHNPRTP
jgi:hypothetical protein